jgi:CheY-like chemotaxis protein
MIPRRRVLCVDDDHQVLSVTKELLEWKGYEVEAVSNGEDAVAKLPQQFDLLILDYNLPDINGNIVAERWKREYPSISILMVSGCEDLPAHALENVNRYLTKGCATKVFLGVISELTKSHTAMCA